MTLVVGSCCLSPERKASLSDEQQHGKLDRRLDRQSLQGRRLAGRRHPPEFDDIKMGGLGGGATDLFLKATNWQRGV
jgi:hypothetical protein